MQRFPAPGFTAGAIEAGGQGFQAVQGLQTLHVRDGTIRISFGATNQAEDVDAILAAIDDVPGA